MISPGDVSGKAAEAAAFLKKELALEAAPGIAVVLGSGWNSLIEGTWTLHLVEFDSIPGLAPPSVEGHRGNVRVVEAGGGRLLVQQGRLRYYEGLSPLEVVFPVWAYAALGVELLVMLFAAGGLNPGFIPGDLMIVSDHLFLRGAGLPEEEGRTTFLQDALYGCLPQGTRVERGVDAFVTGPSFEAPAEAGLLRIAGADAVGMSTAPEALSARYLGMQVAAMACISNSILPSGMPVSHEAVLEVVRRTAGNLPGLIDGLGIMAGPVM